MQQIFLLGLVDMTGIINDQWRSTSPYNSKLDFFACNLKTVQRKHLSVSGGRFFDFLWNKKARSTVTEMKMGNCGLNLSGKWH